MADKPKKPAEPTERPKGAKVPSERSEALPNNVVNLRERRSDKKVVDRAKAQFLNIQHEGSGLDDEEYKNYIMLIIADLVVLVIRARFYREPAKALKRGIDWIAGKYS